MVDRLREIPEGGAEVNTVTRFTRGLMMLLAFGLLAASCEHKDLCMDHRHKARVRVDVDWSRFTVEQPTGMSVMFFPADGTQPQTVLSNELRYVEADLKPGTYHCMAYNQSPSEFGTLSFAGMERLSTASVYANTRTSRWFKARADEEKLIVEPEWIGTGQKQDLNITQDMVEATEQARRSRQTAAPAENVIATLVPRSVVCSISVTIHLKGIYNLRSARASLDGLADGYRLGLMRPSDAKGTQLLESWTMDVDPDDATRGTIKARIRSFGLPYGHGARADENHLRLSLLLVDGTTVVNADFAVGDSFTRGADDEINLYLEKSVEQPLPDVKPADGSSSGFDATVDDWDEEEKIEIGM